MGKVVSIRATVASNLRLARKQAGLTQQGLAAKCIETGWTGMSPQQISRWERNENTPTYSTLEALARLLGLPHQWFFEAHGDAA